MGIMALFTRFLVSLGLLSGPEGSPSRELSLLLKDIKKKLNKLLFLHFR